MKRLLSLGLILCPVAALSAGDPVSVYPTVPGGSLSQSLPSVVSGGATPATTVPPVMVSQPTWGGAGYALSCPPQLACPSPRQTFLPRPLAGRATGCALRGNLLERLRAWLCGGAGPAHNPGLVFAPPVAAPREWVPHEVQVTGGAGAAGWPSKCDANGGRLFPMGRFAGRCPTPGCADAAPVAVGPRPIVIPLPSAVDSTGGVGPTRPNLLRRLVAAFSPDWAGGYEPVPQAVYGVPMTATATPTTVGTPPGTPLFPGVGMTGGYHFANTAIPVTPLVRTAGAIPPSPQPAPVPTATQPFTRQQ